MPGKPADPRVRIVVLLVLVLLLGALTGHAIGMADHQMGMAIGACIAVLAAIGLLVLPPLALRPAGWVWSSSPPPSGTQPSVARASRPPPRDGTVLRS
jgi:hypothetical protein